MNAMRTIDPRLVLHTALTLLAAACHAGVPIPQKPLDCAVRAAANRGYELAYEGARPGTLIFRRHSGYYTDNLFVVAAVDRDGTWHVEVAPSTMHFADRNDRIDRTLATSTAALEDSAYVRRTCDSQRGDAGLH